MRYFIMSADANGTIDSIVHSFLRNVPSLTNNINDADVVFLPLSKMDYKFNHALEAMKKPWVLFDFCEYGWDWDRKETHFFGKNTYDYEHMKNNPEWKHFDDWVNSNPPKLTFKRELLQKDVSETVVPIEYPCWIIDKPKTETREEFDKRPIEVLFYWGRSHEARTRLHGEIFKQSTKHGYEVVSRFEHFSGTFRDVPPGGRKVWASILCPHFDRMDIRQVLAWNGQSKFSVSLPGAGVKCFRHCESPFNSIMVMQSDTLAWTYPWHHGGNCIQTMIGSDIRSIKGEYGCPEFLTILDSLVRADLYDIYLNGLENLDRYRVKNYVQNHVVKTIESHFQ